MSEGAGKDGRELSPGFLALLEGGRLRRSQIEAACESGLGSPLSPRPPGPPLLGLDEVWGVSPSGGRHGRGCANATVSLSRLAWAMDCHFPGDPVMPGTLMLEALLQLAGAYAAAMGLEGRGRAARIQEMRLLSEVTPADGAVDYELSVRQFSASRRMVIADGTASARGRLCASVSGMAVVVRPCPVGPARIAG